MLQITHMLIRHIAALQVTMKQLIRLIIKFVTILLEEEFVAMVLITTLIQQLMNVDSIIVSLIHGTL